MNSPVRILYERPKLYEKQRVAIFDPLDSSGDPARFSLIEASTKAGKAQPLDALVYTPSGPKLMGDVQVGDELMSIDGAPSRVVGIFPQGRKDVFRVAMSDGRSTSACGDHLWKVWGTRFCRPRIMTTHDLIRRMRRGERLFIPVTDPDRGKKRVPLVLIASVEAAGDAECQCIAVSHPSHLYVTDDYIVTHNTAGCTAWLVEQGVFGKKGDNYQWVAPVYGQAKIAFRRIKRGISANIRQASAIPDEPVNPSPFTFAKPNESELFIELFNGATLWFKSAEKPDNLYGEDVHAAVLDEASRMREESWHAVRSTLTATRGKARMIGNVKGRANWFYKLARKAQMGAKGLSFHRITAFDAVAAGVLDMEEIEDARARLPENVFRELYMAEASEDDTNPFGYAHIEACILPELSDEAPVVIGVDLAKSSDWTVLIGLDRDMRVCGFERWQAPWRETKARLAALIGKTPTLVDETGVGNPVVEDLQSVLPNVEGFTFSASSKQQLMERLVVEIQQRRLRFPDGLIRQELDTFEYEHVRNGVRYTAPAGFHDDCVMSLALAAKHFRDRFPLIAGQHPPAEIIRVSPWLGFGAGEEEPD